jgi:hypothetical protein
MSPPAAARPTPTPQKREAMRPAAMPRSIQVPPAIFVRKNRLYHNGACFETRQLVLRSRRRRVEGGAPQSL